MDSEDPVTIIKLQGLIPGQDKKQLHLAAELHPDSRRLHRPVSS